MNKTIKRTLALVLKKQQHSKKLQEKELNLSIIFNNQNPLQ